MPRAPRPRPRRELYALDWRSVRLVVAAPPALLRRAARLLGVPLEAAVGAEPASAAVSVSRRSGEYVLRGRYEEFATRSRNDALMKLVALLSFHLLEASADTVLHAGAFACGAGAAIFCGPPLAGKSSLAVAAWRRGFTLLGDDWLVVDADTNVRPFPKPVKVRLAGAPSAAHLGKGAERADVLSARLGDEVRLALGRHLPGMVAPDTSMPASALFLIGRDRGPTRLEPASSDEALRAVLIQTMHTRGRRLGGVALLEKLRRDGRVYRLTIGENDVEGALDAIVATCDGDRRDAVCQSSSARRRGAAIVRA